jgi:molybdopterin-guanine dinucleotide biosynthesis protein A
MNFSIGNITGAVLVGGKSSRMGKDKALMPYQETTMLGHALDILEPWSQELMVIGDPKKYSHIYPNTVADIRPECGPLGGIATVLHYSSNDENMIIGCDMPNLNTALFDHLRLFMLPNVDAVIPVNNGNIEPLAGLYHRRCKPSFMQSLEDSVFKMSDALALVRATFVEVNEGSQQWPVDLFKNINSKGDL